MRIAPARASNENSSALATAYTHTGTDHAVVSILALPDQPHCGTSAQPSTATIGLGLFLGGFQSPCYGQSTHPHCWHDMPTDPITAGQTCFDAEANVIYALCFFCGEPLDKDTSICRACGADNDPSADEGESLDLTGIDLDRLNSWSIVKHDIVSKYLSAYTTILHQQRWVKRY